MKNSKKCIKCESSKVVKIKGPWDGTGANVILTGYTIFSGKSVNRFLCCDCGYSEEWVEKSLG